MAIHDRDYSESPIGSKMLLSSRKTIIDIARICFKVRYLHEDRDLSGRPVHAIALIDRPRIAPGIPALRFERVFQGAQPLVEALIGERAATPGYCMNCLP